jgi:DNA-binding GntR family transcriptional regulator
VERRIAEELGTSKTPVREALIALARSGLVEVTRNRATHVRRLTIQEAQYIYEERLLLEPWAVAQAVSRPDADFRDAWEALAEAKSYGGPTRSAGRAVANRKFHRAMYAFCSNPFVTRALDSLQDLTALATTSLLWDAWQSWEDEMEEHAAICEAAEARDAERASELMREHVGSSLARIRALPNRSPEGHE